MTLSIKFLSLKALSITAFAVLFLVPVAELTAAPIPETNAEVGVARQQLISGTATTARPEVGQFGGCTGTLVAPRWVVTASHCNGHISLFFPGGTSPLTFNIDPPTGARQSFVVERAYSLGFPVGPNDVMLLRLATPVPETLARAARIAARAPASGSTVTLFGYGCNPTAPTLGGQKQTGTRTMTIGTRGEFTTANALCPGDSGGPIFDARGRLFGVNSQFVGSPPTQTDIYGDVIRRRSDIFAMMLGGDITGDNDITMSGWCTGARDALYYGDINGDSSVDAICHNEASGVVRYASGAPGAIRPQGEFAGPFCSHDGAEFHVGDFDGDRRTDIFCIDRNTGRKWVDLSAGNWVAPYGGRIDYISTSNWCSHATAQLHIGDFNGDGRSDMLCHDTRTGHKWIDFSMVGGAGMFGSNDWDNAGNWCSHPTTTLLASDFNGDGRSDLLCHTGMNGSLDVKLARAGDVFGSATFWQNISVNFCARGSGRLAAFEMTGDTRAELFCLQQLGGGNVIISMGGVDVPFQPEVSWSMGGWAQGFTRPMLVGSVAAQPWARSR